MNYFVNNSQIAYIWIMEVLKLKELLKQKGLSSKWLSETLGISQGYISDILRHKKTPSIETLMDISKALDIDIRDLFNPTKETSEKYYLEEETGKRIKIINL